MDYRGRIFRDEGARLRHLASFPEENPNPTFEVGADGSLVYANPAALRLFPDLPAEGSRHPLLAGLDLYASETKPAGSRAFEAEAGGAVYRLEVSTIRPGGSLRVYATDITDQKMAEEALIGSREELRGVVEYAGDAFFAFDRAGNILDVNRRACESLDYTRDELLSLSMDDVEKGISPEDVAGLWDLTEPGRPITVDGSLRRKDGTTFPVEVGISAIDYGGRRLILASCRDITERKALEKALDHRASHDPLTGLANRDLFEERVRQALARAARHGRMAAVLFVDLDDFKGVNDAFGHRVGDRLLAEVAGRLKDGVRIEDTVGRLGGDEFVVLLEDLARDDEALLVARRVGAMLRAPFVLDGRTLAVTASIGAALGPSGDDPLGQDLIGEADAAMYRAKHSGKNRQELFRPAKESL